MVKKIIETDLRRILESLGYQPADSLLYISKDAQFGDYSTNVPLQLAKLQSKNSKQSPLVIANEITEKLKSSDSAQDHCSEIKVAGAGFINFFIKDQFLIKNLDTLSHIDKIAKPRNILVEYAQPNTHKLFHLGHLRNIVLGESICRILESQGEKVFRANYQGDIGLHVAKALWAITQSMPIPEELGVEKKADFLGNAYVTGAQAYEQDPRIKGEIDHINNNLYQKDPKVMNLWQETRSWSLDYFESIYKRLGVKFDKLFFESEAESLGKKLVEKNLHKVFQIDQKAVIFPGQKYGLHTRVFITKAGNPTYEAKDLGLAQIEYNTFPFDLAIHVVASEQSDYFKVVFKALEMIDPRFSKKQYHLSYGMVNLKTGKMSSRQGEVVTADWLFAEVKRCVMELMKQNRLDSSQDVVEKVSIGAIKFSLLKFSTETDMSFDIDRSIAIQGDSGPYVQYAYARIKSVLGHAGTDLATKGVPLRGLETEERQVLRQLMYFSEIVEEAGAKYSPNLIASYLLDLSKFFNLFYQTHRILQSEKKKFRLQLSEATGEVIHKGLMLLGIEAPERM